MKKFLSVLCTTVLVLSLAGVAGAMTYTFEPSDFLFLNNRSNPVPDDLWDLSHGNAYTWNIGVVDVPVGETIVEASLSFKNIRNWSGESTYDLWINLFDSSGPLGVRRHYDSVTGNYFTGQGLEVVHWDETVLPKDPDPGIDITYDFTDSALTALNSYVKSDGIFGLGFDPDCHFWNDGITLNIKTVSDPVVPEPSTILLVGLGLVGLIGLGGKRFRK